MNNEDENGVHGYVEHASIGNAKYYGGSKMAQASLRVFSVIYTDFFDGITKTGLIGTFNSFSNAIDGLRNWLVEQDLEFPEEELQIPDDFVVLDVEGYVMYLEDLEILVVSSDLRFS